MARRPSRKSAAAAAKPVMGPDEAVVRMYRQGLGDCFLVFLPKSDGTTFTIMIDCGVIVGTEAAEAKMRQVVENISAATDGKVDLLVVTHEHWDHVSGFLEAADLFSRDGSDGLVIGSIWFAWTEDPDDGLARELREGLNLLLERVAGMGIALAGMARDTGASAAADGYSDRPLDGLADGIGEVLGFFGLERHEALGGEFATDGEEAPRLGRTRKAMDAVRELSADIHYRLPGEPPWRDPQLPGLSIFTLGPPRDRMLLRKTDPGRQGYHMAFDGDVTLAAAIGRAQDADAQPGPFDRNWCLPLPNPDDEPDAPDTPRGFINRHYIANNAAEAFTTDIMRIPGVRDGTRATLTFEIDQSWRRIDTDWAGEAAEFALALDGATNNTSLVLATELSPGGPVLLFVGDAQAGNWLSWDSLSWTLGDRTVTSADLLSRTIFYKVGHHGSHNATLKGKGVERMTRRDLVAFVPVDRPTARSKRWRRMPLPSMMEALETQTGRRLVLSEVTPPADEGSWSEAGFAEGPYKGRLRKEDLFVEVRLPL